MTESKILDFFRDQEPDEEMAADYADIATRAFFALFKVVQEQGLFGLWDALGCCDNRTRKEELLYQALGPLCSLQKIDMDQSDAYCTVGKAVFGPDFDPDDPIATEQAEKNAENLSGDDK